MTRWLWLIPALLLLAACRPITPEAAEPPAATAPSVTATLAANPGVILGLQGFFRQIHDPVIAREGDTYYAFSTGPKVIVIKSPDMISWEWSGRVFDKNPPWTLEVNSNLGALWAPDISYFNGLWHLYFAASTFGTQDSALGLATTPTLDPESPDFAWEDHGIVLRSLPGDLWNAIDPNLVLDENGDPWLAWGSYWHGIFIQRIDPATGMLATGSEAINLADHTDASGRHRVIEAPFLVRRDGYWHLFTSWDQCCQGAASTYHVRIGRSESLTGPYVDRDGMPLLEGGGTTLLDAYGQWRGPGHNAVFSEDGVDWMVYHAYDAQINGIPKLRIESIVWDVEGWPTLSSQSSSN